MKKKKQILGITGSFGSGKTTCAKMFKSLGAAVVDADSIYHQLLKPETLVYKKIVAVFGPEILDRKKRINRKKIAKLVFNNSNDDNAQLKRLTEITHPDIIKKIKKEISRLKKDKGTRAIIIDGPLLIEAGLSKMLDKLIVVKVNRKNQIRRCRRCWEISINEINSRIKTQLPLAKKVKLADYIIGNNGTLKKTREQVKNIWRQILAKESNDK